MKLIVGTVSTWSLRAWLCAKIAGVELIEQVIALDKSDGQSELLHYSKSGLVPVLINEQLTIHDSLAIMEYLNEISGGKLLPTDANERALARSQCAELHSGFMNLRTTCPFTLQPVNASPDTSGDLSREIGRIETIFGQATLPYMFKNVGAVDAFWSVLAFRLKHYGVSFDGKAGEYQKSLLTWPLFQEGLTEMARWGNENT